jgi:Protein of unknown function (DUF1439)
MKRRIILGLACVLVLVFAGVWWYFSGKRYEVIITQKQIDEALQARFPVSKTHLLLFQITYSNPRVTLLPETGRIEIGLDAELNIKLGEQPKRLGGSALVTTGLSYQSETHQFFLSEPEINKLTIQGVPPEYIDRVTSLATSTAREHLQRFPIYTVEAKDIKTAAVKLLLKDVQVKSNQVHVTLGL